MSLTSAIARDPAVRSFFDQEFPRAREVAAEMNVLSASTPLRFPTRLSKEDARAVGMAFNYRLAFSLRRVPLEDTVAALGLENILLELLIANEWTPDHEVALRSLFRDIARVVSEVRPARRRLNAADERRLAACCLALAFFEEHYRDRDPQRSGRTAFRTALRREPTLVGLKRAVGERAAAIDDLKGLAVAAQGDFRRFYRQRITLGPVFLGSGRVGGADADLIAGSTLIETKTSRLDAPISLEHVYQLVGYFLLDAHDEFEVRSLAFYLPRRGLLVSRKAESFLEHASGRHRSFGTWRRLARRAFRAYNIAVA